MGERERLSLRDFVAGKFEEVYLSSGGFSSNLFHLGKREQCRLKQMTTERLLKTQPSVLLQAKVLPGLLEGRM